MINIMQLVNVFAKQETNSINIDGKMIDKISLVWIWKKAYYIQQGGK